MVDDRDFGDIAAEYAQRGWAVLPLHSIVNGKCSCGRSDCGSPGKHPLNSNGVTGATRDTDQIARWWQQWPWANIGIATGMASGLAVVDIDPRNGGLATLPELELPNTLSVETGGGGYHFYYTIDKPTTKRKLGAGVDFQADGGYVVAPPSLHVLGVYKWVGESTLAPLPKTYQNGSSNGTTPKPLVELTSTIQPDQKTWVVDLLNKPCPQGQRNETLTRLAGYFRNLLPQAVAVALLKQWSRERCDPPLSEREIEQNVKHKYSRYGGPAAEQTPKLWTARTLLEATMPDPVWVVESLLPEGLAFLAGRPKRGKSWLALQLCIDATSNGQSLGKYVRQGKVIYIALEDSPRRLQKRLTLMRANPSDDLIFLTEFAKLDDGGLGDLAELLDLHHPILVVIDTLSRAVSRLRDQDKNSDMTDLLDPIQKLALGYSCTIMLIDHHRKPGIDISDAIDDIMGSTAKGGVADVIWGLYRKSGESYGSLKLTGRDIEETELAVVWDGLKFNWRVEGTAADRAILRHMGDVIELLRHAGEADLRTMANHFQLSEDTMAEVVREMKAQRLIAEMTVTTGQRGRPRFVYSLTPTGMGYSEKSEK